MQLGNVTEAIRDTTTDGNTSAYQSQIASLQSEVTALTSNNAGLSQQLADTNQMVAQLQLQIQSHSAGDVTPDSVAEVISSLGIQHG